MALDELAHTIGKLGAGEWELQIEDGGTVDVVLDEAGETIESVAFEGEGCAISQAAASLLSERLPGMSLAEVRALDRDDATEMLGGDISPMRVKCAVLAEKVVQDGTEIHLGEKEAETTSLED